MGGNLRRNSTHDNVHFISTANSTTILLCIMFAVTIRTTYVMIFFLTHLLPHCEFNSDKLNNLFIFFVYVIKK